jgi:hypothetical protein
MYHLECAWALQICLKLRELSIVSYAKTSRWYTLDTQRFQTLNKSDVRLNDLR